MKVRSRQFLRVHILPLLLQQPQNPHGHNTPTSTSTSRDRRQGQLGTVIAIVAHSVILQILWICIAELFDPGDIHFGPGLSQADFEDRVAPVWSNTGVMELKVESKPREWPRDPAASSPLSGWAMAILAVDSVAHLLADSGGQGQVEYTGRAIRGGLYDSRKQIMDDFYRITGTA